MGDFEIIVDGNHVKNQDERSMKFENQEMQIHDRAVVSVAYRFALDSSQPLKRITWTGKTPRNGIHAGAYSLDAESLTIAVSHQATSPPTSLAPSPGVTVYKLKRKPAH